MGPSQPTSLRCIEPRDLARVPAVGQPLLRGGSEVAISVGAPGRRHGAREPLACAPVGGDLLNHRSQSGKSPCTRCVRTTRALAAATAEGSSLGTSATLAKRAGAAGARGDADRDRGLPGLPGSPCFTPSMRTRHVHGQGSVRDGGRERRTTWRQVRCRHALSAGASLATSRIEVVAAPPALRFGAGRLV